MFSVNSYSWREKLSGDDRGLSCFKYSIDRNIDVKNLKGDSKFDLSWINEVKRYDWNLIMLRLLLFN